MYPCVQIVLLLCGAHSLVVNPTEYFQGMQLVSMASQVSNLSSLGFTFTPIAQHNKCFLCQKTFKNSTYLNLHLLHQHLPIEGFVPFDKVCDFSKCTNNKYPKPKLDNQIKMEMCIQWTLTHILKGEIDIENVRRVDVFCKELIINGNRHKELQSVNILTWLLKAGLGIVVLMFVCSLHSHIKACNKKALSLKQE